MATPSVEVKCIETFAFYPAFLRDYNAATGQVLVAYPNAWKKDEWVKIEDVRNAPPQFDPTTFAPQAGDIVEAQAKVRPTSGHRERRSARPSSTRPDENTRERETWWMDIRAPVADGRCPTLLRVLLPLLLSRRLVFR